MRHRTRRQNGRRGYHAEHAHQLATGHDFFGDGFGDDMEAMRTAWPILRDEAFADERSRHRFTMPAAWWWFESPTPRDTSVDEVQQLIAMGLVDADEVAAHEAAERAARQAIAESPNESLVANELAREVNRETP